MYLIKGFALNSTDPSDIELVLNEMKASAEKDAKRAYRELLQREIETLVDDISLGVFNRPEESIYEWAVSELNNRIAYATAKQNETPYNLHLSVHVLFAESKTIFTKRIAKIKGLKDFSIKDSIEPDPKQKEWEDIFAKYAEGVSPLGVQVYPNGPIEISKETLKFRSPMQRAEERARYNLTNRYLSMFSCEQQIPNFRLMQRMDEAIMQLSTPEAKEEMQRMKVQLSGILPNITLALIDPKENNENDDTQNPVIDEAIEIETPNS